MIRRTVLAVLALTAASAVEARAACSLSVGGVAFGVYDVFDPAPTDSTGTIEYICGPADRNIRITISPGSSGTYAPRELRAGAERLAYNLYLDSAFTQVWGDDTGGTGSVLIKNPQPNNVWLSLTVFARLPAGQDAAVGSYGDTVVVTLEY